MPVLPIIDLLILLGWTSLFAAFALKTIKITTSYLPSLFGLGPMDFTILAGIFLLFSLALSARTWVKTHEGRPFDARERAAATLEAYSVVQAEAQRAQAGSGRGGAESAPDRAAEGARSAVSA
jgi:hypothetical protein